MSDDVAPLIRRLEAAIDETRRKYMTGGKLVVVGSVVVAGLAAVRHIWFLVPVCLVFGAAMYLLMRVAIKRTGSAVAAPVLRALADTPDRVLTVEHRQTSDSMRLFVTDWIEVKTADGRLFVRAPDWESLIEQLAHRCPAAAVKR